MIIVRGGGDLASGVVYRLHRAGFPVLVTELARPLFVRRTVSYGEAVYSGEMTVDGITARRAAGLDEASAAMNRGEVPVMVDPDGECLRLFTAQVVVDARLAKKNLGTRLDDAPLVIGLGPGFTAGVDCHAVVETLRGHNLGRVLWHGSAQPDTGIPEGVDGHSRDRVLRAPADGHVAPRKQIGESAAAGEVIAEVSGSPIVAPFAGVLRGLIHPQVPVKIGMKVGDLDPRGNREYCFTISDKALAVGGGVLEAALTFLRASYSFPEKFASSDAKPASEDAD